ncbi:primosome assembly protein PriA [Clostridium putrefaciens]|uniref:Primosome assembly protein PriA n=1 Tax=Clostridium putrefaciens TaxID=99675 RepID=A0A381K6B0_9CLOT|nr:primosome assembly protein PriA [Clostridium putrefaciens]
MIERFKGRFGKDVAVFHSKLSDGERFDEWFRVKEGKAKLAVGARSAVFLPFKDLGIIIIDEEHEASYKSDSNPKYDAREIAKYRSKLEGCRVILGTATPSIESYYKAETREIELLNMERE